MSDRVDAAMARMEPPDLYAPVDSRCADAQPEQLRMLDNPTLAFRRSPRSDDPLRLDLA